MGSGASKNTTISTTIANNHQANGTTSSGENNKESVKVDSRLPFNEFRELFTLKNYWKTVRRNDSQCAKNMLHKYLKMCPEAKSRYPKLASLDIDSPECSDPAFEGMASNYLKVFDEVITSVEQTPADASSACQRLSSVGKMHRSKVNGMKFDDFQQLEAPFL
uniref:GLOBIN domain-containing protein n=1 Tax=Meloidogyne hapla TaxID=6305 RepID=A0A1I8B2H1_MELHA